MDPDAYQAYFVPGDNLKLAPRAPRLNTFNITSLYLSLILKLRFNLAPHPSRLTIFYITSLYLSLILAPIYLGTLEDKYPLPPLATPLLGSCHPYLLYSQLMSLRCEIKNEGNINIVSSLLIIKVC